MCPSFSSHFPHSLIFLTQHKAEPPLKRRSPNNASLLAVGPPAPGYAPVIQVDSLFFMRIRRWESISPIAPRRILRSTTARRPILMTLDVFKPER
jgi:hypothetical protein